MDSRDCILFSGGAQGAEAEFGARAERHGIEEVTSRWRETGSSASAACGCSIARSSRKATCLAYVSGEAQLRERPVDRAFLVEEIDAGFTGRIDPHGNPRVSC